MGHFVLSPREREKRDRRESRGDEREGQGRKRNRNESEETEEKLEKVSIGHRCPHQNATQKKVTYIIVTGKHEVIIKVDMAHTRFTIWNLVKDR